MKWRRMCILIFSKLDLYDRNADRSKLMFTARNNYKMLRCPFEVKFSLLLFSSLPQPHCGK